MGFLGLKVNPDKCKLMVVGGVGSSPVDIGGVSLPREAKLRFLGVDIDCKGHFSREVPDGMDRIRILWHKLRDLGLLTHPHAFVIAY